MTALLHWVILTWDDACRELTGDQWASAMLLTFKGVTKPEYATTTNSTMFCFSCDYCGAALGGGSGQWLWASGLCPSWRRPSGKHVSVQKAKARLAGLRAWVSPWWNTQERTDQDRGKRCRTKSKAPWESTACSTGSHGLWTAGLEGAMYRAEAEASRRSFLPMSLGKKNREGKETSGKRRCCLSLRWSVTGNNLSQGQGQE